MEHNARDEATTAANVDTFPGGGRGGSHGGNEKLQH
jgi:hypothetical protein